MIAIVIESGVLQAVYTDKKEQDAYILIDHDNINAGDKGLEIHHTDSIVDNLHDVFEGDVKQWLIDIGY